MGSFSEDAVADLEIQKGISDMHVVYGQQNNNISTHNFLNIHKQMFHYHNDLAALQF